MITVPASTTSPSGNVSPARLDRSSWICLVLAAVLVLGLIALLWPQWLHNPDLSHGWFVPLVFLVLLHEARTAGPQRYLPARRGTIVALGLALALGVFALVGGGMYAAALEWSHPLVGFSFAVALALLLGAALIGFAHESVRRMPFNWSSVLAVGLWVFSAPIPPGTYHRLSLALQMWVSENVLRALHLLGIPAYRRGNIIELLNTSVGIEDACSGVRSLVSCVFAGLFFSGCLVRGVGARVLLIALAAPLAILMNFIRSLGLTLLANAGVDIRGSWHDVTGFAVLGITGAFLGGLALLLERREKSRAPAPPPTPDEPRRRGTQHPLRWVATGLGFAAVLAALFALQREIRVPRENHPVPNLAAVLPEQAAGWHVTTADDLNRFSAQLQTEYFIQRTYLRDTPEGQLQLTVYVAYWAPGQASASLVATHTPDACWPGAGWEPVPLDERRQRLVTITREVPEGEYRLFHNQHQYPQYVWFWHLYDGAPVPHIDPLSPRNLLEIAARYGFRRAGEQTFVRVSSNRPWNALAHEPLLAEIFSNLQPLGL